MAVGDYRDIGMFNPVGSHNDGLDISSAATITIPSTATKWMAQALVKNVKYTLDGTAPTSTKGFQLTAGNPAIVIPIGKDTSIKVIQQEATADLQYQFGE